MDLGLEQVKLAEQGDAYNSPGAPPYYKYRVVVPFLVRVLPFESKTGFKCVSIFACFLTLICLGLILLSLKLDMFSVTSGIILGAFSYTIIYSLNYPYMPDAMNNVAITACFLGLVRRNIILVAAALVIGYFNHGTIIAYLFLVPLFFSNIGKLVDKKGLLTFISIGCIMLLAKKILISVLGGEGVQSGYLGHFTLANLAANWNSKGGVPGASARVYITFNLLWFLAALGFRGSDLHIKKSWVMIIPMIMFFILLSDTRRHLSYLLPVIVTTGSYYFASHNRNIWTVLNHIFILITYIFINLLASRDTVEFFLSIRWPDFIDKHIFLIIGLANLTGVILIYNKMVLNFLQKKGLVQ